MKGFYLIAVVDWSGMEWVPMYLINIADRCGYMVLFQQFLCIEQNHYIAEQWYKSPHRYKSQFYTENTKNWKYFRIIPFLLCNSLPLAFAVLNSFQKRMQISICLY